MEKTLLFYIFIQISSSVTRLCLLFRKLLHLLKKIMFLFLYCPKIPTPSPFITERDHLLDNTAIHLRRRIILSAVDVISAITDSVHWDDFGDCEIQEVKYINICHNAWFDNKYTEYNVLTVSSKMFKIIR